MHRGIAMLAIKVTIHTGCYICNTFQVATEEYSNSCHIATSGQHISFRRTFRFT